MLSTLKIVHGSITDLDVDCIVNAANDKLQHGGGVCGAIFKAAGAKELQDACNMHGGCPHRYGCNYTWLQAEGSIYHPCSWSYLAWWKTERGEASL